jgi:enamine deaminase RidA (YjgF/YER057c/UK114 family)
MFISLKKFSQEKIKSQSIDYKTMIPKDWPKKLDAVAAAENTHKILLENTESKDEHAVPEFFLLRPEVEKAYGYSHAVKIGNSIKVSGAVSMDDQGNPTAVGNLEQQMKNCYADLEKVLAHYGCTFNDVVVENVFTTNMPKFLEVAGYRNEITKITFQQGLGLVLKNWQFQNLLLK